MTGKTLGCSNLSKSVYSGSRRREIRIAFLVLLSVGSDWLIVLVNEDEHPHMGVEVEGLEALNGQRLELLYGTESATVRKGEFITRLMPMEVKVFATSRKWESAWQTGRGYANGQNDGRSGAGSSTAKGF